MVAALLEQAQRSVSALAAETQGRRDRTQRVAFAVIRLAGALEAARRADGPAPAKEDSAAPQGLALSTRQAIQVGIAASLAIVVGELVSPARWYWAVLTAFFVFATDLGHAGEAMQPQNLPATA